MQIFTIVRQIRIYNRQNVPGKIESFLSKTRIKFQRLNVPGKIESYQKHELNSDHPVICNSSTHRCQMHQNCTPYPPFWSYLIAIGEFLQTLLQ